MDRGSYTAASGGLAQFRKLEIVNNNLANINTPGFKREIILTDAQRFDNTFAKEFEKRDPFARADHDRSPGAVNIRAVTDFSPGPIKSTGNPLDVALKGEKQFFVVQTPEGEQYTRAGNFTLNAEGEVVTADGFPVLGDGGPLTANGPGVDVTPNGTLRVDGQDAGRFRIVQFDDTTGLERAGGSRFVQRGGAAPASVEGEVIPRSLEMANVSAISSIVELITTQRGFDMYSKASMTIDQMNQQAIQQVGRSRI